MLLTGPGRQALSSGPRLRLRSLSQASIIAGIKIASRTIFFFNRPYRRARPGVLLRKKPIKTLFSGGRGRMEYFFKNRLTRRAGIGYFYTHQRDARLPPAPKNNFSAGLDSEGIDPYISIRLTPKGKKFGEKMSVGRCQPHM